MKNSIELILFVLLIANLPGCANMISSSDRWKPLMLESEVASGKSNRSINQSYKDIVQNTTRSNFVTIKNEEEYKIPEVSINAYPLTEELLRAKVTEQGRENYDDDKTIQTKIEKEIQLYSLKERSCFRVSLFSRRSAEYITNNQITYKLFYEDNYIEGEYLVKSGVSTIPRIVDQSISQYGSASLWNNSNFICFNKKINYTKSFSLIAILQGSEVTSYLNSNKMKLDWNE